MQLYKRHSHDSGETFVRVSNDSHETFVIVSHGSGETFVRVSRDSRANVAQLYFLAIKSPNGLIYVAIYSHLYRIFVALCGSRKLDYDVSAKG